MAIELPDWGANLGRSFANLGIGLRDILNPNFDFQEELRKGIEAGHPIIQDLADQAYVQGSLPRSLVDRLPHDIRDAIFSANPSPAALRQRNATLAYNNLPDEQKTGLGLQGLTGLSPEEAAISLTKAPLVAGVANQPPGTVPSTLAEAGAQRGVSGLTAGAEAEDAMKAGLAPVALDYMNQLKAKDAENTKAGHPTNYYQRAAAEQFGLLRDEQFRMTIEDRLMFMRLRQQERLDAIAEHESNYWVNKSGGIGSPELWRYLLYDPKAVGRLQEIRSTGPKNVDDATLLRMQNYRESNGANAERAFYTQSVVQRDKLLDAINGNAGKRIMPDDDSRRPSDIAGLNAELVREGTPIEAYWGQPPTDAKGETKLRFRLRGHKTVEIQPDQVFNVLQKADQTFTGSNIQVSQPSSSGQVPVQAKPPVQVTHNPPVGGGNINTDTTTQAGMWNHLRLITPISVPDSIITNRVNAHFSRKQ